MKGLGNILNSVSASHHSIALPGAYAPLILLANQQQKIADDLSLGLDEFREWLSPLIPLVANLWILARNRPQLFAQFSLPPATVPNPVIVHNWAFASMAFAESLQEHEQILAALAGAMAEPTLQNSIALARATQSAAETSVEIDPEEMRKENRDIFYSTLGRRLVVLQRLDGEHAQAMCGAMLEQCFRHGPRDLDAAVLLAAARFDMGATVLHADASDYVKRMGDNRNLRLALLPLLEMLGVRL